jgi:hypothetical protein
MHAQTSALVILAAAIVVAALVFSFSPLLWTDHYINDRVTKPLPAGCSILTQPTGGSAVIVAHCPAWVQLS